MHKKLSCSIGQEVFLFAEICNSHFLALYLQRNYIIDKLNYYGYNNTQL